MCEFSICGAMLENKTLSFETFQISESGLPNLYFVFNLIPTPPLHKIPQPLTDPRTPAVCSGVGLT